MVNDAILATSQTRRVHGNGDIELTLRVPKRSARELDAMLDPRDYQCTMAIVRVRPYGELAKKLRLSRFFFTPRVWAALAADLKFLAWLPTRKCCAKSNQPCAGDVVAAHTRRIALGAGVGIKPIYSAVPLCHMHHCIQHGIGESAIGGKEYIDRERIKFLGIWAWHQLKQTLNYHSMAEVPPEVIYRWASAKRVEQYLPAEYQP